MQKYLKLLLYEGEEFANDFMKEHVTPYVSGKLKKYMPCEILKESKLNTMGFK